MSDNLELLLPSILRSSDARALRSYSAQEHQSFRSLDGDIHGSTSASNACNNSNDSMSMKVETIRSSMAASTISAAPTEGSPVVGATRGGALRRKFFTVTQSRSSINAIDLSSKPHSESRRKSSDKKVSKRSVSSGVMLPTIKKQRRNASASDRFIYRYQVLPGNNSRAILAEFRKRPWWYNAITAASSASPDCDRDHSPLPDLCWEMYKDKAKYNDPQTKRLVVNHLFLNQCLVSKRGLYRTIINYCNDSGDDALTIIPRTFYLNARESDGDDDLVAFEEFNSNFTRKDDVGPATGEAVWILKPAAKTNCGIGIKVAQGVETAMDIVRGRDTARSSEKKRALCVGWIVQQYIERPLLVSGRKFDIRCYVLVTLDRSGTKAYYFDGGYVRTSGKAFSMKNLKDKEAHLTNDAIQKKSKSYGSFEPGNKLNFEEWAESIKREYPSAPEGIVQNAILPRIRELVLISVKAASAILRPEDRGGVDRSFELMGYDFMVTEDFKPTLIEINSNPCLEFVCPLLESAISSMLHSLFVTVIDSWFPPPPRNSRTQSQQAAIDAIEAQPNLFQQVFP